MKCKDGTLLAIFSLNSEEPSGINTLRNNTVIS